MKTRTPDSAPVTPRALSGSAPFWRYILIGFFTVAPLWVTWLVFDFLFSLLARTGAPLLWGASRGVSPFSKNLAEWLINPSVQYVLAALATLLALHFIGLFTSMVVGRRLIAFMEGLLARLPLVQTIYGATKRLLQSLQKPPATGQRVALISFPNAGHEDHRLHHQGDQGHVGQRRTGSGLRADRAEPDVRLHRDRADRGRGADRLDGGRGDDVRHDRRHQLAGAGALQEPAPGRCILADEPIGNRDTVTDEESFLAGRCDRVIDMVAGRWSRTR